MQLSAEWNAPAGCSFLKDSPPPSNGGGKEGEEGEGGGDGEKKEKVGSGVGWFFLL